MAALTPTDRSLKFKVFWTLVVLVASGQTTNMGARMFFRIPADGVPMIDSSDTGGSEFKVVICMCLKFKVLSG